ncbi:MAG: formyltransferase family protein [Myxococcales bacterium]
MRLAFLGLPLAALLLAFDGHDIVWAALNGPRAPGTRRLRRLLGARLELRPSDLVATTTLRALAPDLIVSWFWTRRIPPSVLETARLGGLGVHPSLLPRHRGPDPYFWAIDAGDVQTGVTAHVLDESYDTGALLASRALRIDPTWNAWTLAKRLDRPSLALLRDVVGAYARGVPPEARAQNDADATEAPAPDDTLLELRWGETASALVRRVRAASPWPGAYTELAGETLVLTEVRETRDFPRALVAGEAAVRADGIAVICAKDNAIELHRGRLESSDEPLDAAAFAARVRRA